MGRGAERQSDALAPSASPQDALVTIAAAIPTPSDAYGPARAYAEVRQGGFGAVFGLDGGRRNEPVGPVFQRPRPAIELSELFNRRLIAV